MRAQDKPGEDDEKEEAQGPQSALEPECQVRFHKGGVGEKRQQRAGVREREEAEPDRGRTAGGVGFLAREPALQQRAGGGEQKEGETDGAGETPEDGGDRVRGAAEAGAEG